MLCLSRRDIENIGEAALTDCAMANARIFKIPLDLVWFARRYLGLRVEFRKLSENGRILGLTAQSGVTVELQLSGGAEEITVREDTVFLDGSLLKDETVSLMRFTLAHECAHHIISRIEEKRTGISFRRRFDPEKRYACRELKTSGDWREWQANALSAVLLIPKSALTPHLTRWGKPCKLTSYGGRFNTRDYGVIRKLAETLRVSEDVVKIRLKDTGNLIYKHESELCDPLDIIAG